jgi:hypothetical protein
LGEAHVYRKIFRFLLISHRKLIDKIEDSVIEDRNGQAANSATDQNN